MSSQVSEHRLTLAFTGQVQRDVDDVGELQERADRHMRSIKSWTGAIVNKFSVLLPTLVVDQVIRLLNLSKETQETRDRGEV